MRATRAALLATVLVHFGGAALADSDQRTFTRIVHRATFPRAASVYARIEATPGPPEPLFVPLWDGLAVRLVPLGHVGVDAGVFAYAVQLLSGDDGSAPVLRPTNQPAHGITADVVAAFHFRNRENSGPNTVGPLNLNAPGELRQLRYPALTAEIRVLEFHIVDAKAGVVPSFSSLALLITVKEESADRSGGTP